MRTIINFFEEKTNKFADKPYLWEKKSTKFESISYKETYDIVDLKANALLSLGLKKGERVALLSEGRNDWILSELAVLHTGAVNVPLSIKLETSELLFRLNHSEAKIIIISKLQSVKLKVIENDLKFVEKIIYLDDIDDCDDNKINWTSLDKIGADYKEHNPDALNTIKNAIVDDDYANISYTSGTTADPKGILLSHRNYTANVEQALSIMSIPSSWRTLVILPLDHCFAHVVGMYSFMSEGASIATVQSGKTGLQTLKNIPINIKEIKPDMMMSVPALAKNFKKNIEKGIVEKGRFTHKMFKYALKVSYKYNKEGHNKGKGLNALRGPIVALFDKILFKKIREVFGGNMKYFIGGGALLDIELQRFYYAIGIPMLQGYGLSEATPVISSNGLEKHILGSSGYLVKPLEVKICDAEGKSLPLGKKGEIVIKGENVMKGYWKNPEATAETIKDNWLYTGDMGYLAADDYLYVLGRFKSLLIASDGEKYSPESIEETLVSKSEFIDQIMLYNDQNPYTIALVVPNGSYLKTLITQHNIDKKDAPKFALKVIMQYVDEYRKGGKHQSQFPERWLPSTFAIIDEHFTEENKFINSTMKMVRGKITDKYMPTINFLYTAEGKDFICEKNIEAIKKYLE